MTFSLDTHWVWDFWVADDGDLFHLYYLHAPKTLGDEHLRHRNARIGHAVSSDLSDWRDLGPVLAPGSPGEFDETAVWTGSVVAGPDGLWRMFYTGSRFLGPDTAANIETIGVATSRDLHTWHKVPGTTVSADPRWYEVLADGTWREEAWRDPWVYADPEGKGWHMLITARARHGEGTDRGVIGHAFSPDLENWTVGPPVSDPGAGFEHLEVAQTVTVAGKHALVFCCDSGALTGDRAGEVGGVYSLPIDSLVGAVPIDRASLLVDDSLYAGRIVSDREGRSVLLAFENAGEGGFIGRIADPIPIQWNADGAGLTPAEVHA